LTILVLGAFGTVQAGTESSPFRVQVNQLHSVENNFEALSRGLDRLLADAPDTKRPHGDLRGAVGRLEAMAHKLDVLERRLTRVMDAAVDLHIGSPSESLEPFFGATADVEFHAQMMDEAIDGYVRGTPRDLVAPEFRDALLAVERRLAQVIPKLDIEFYAWEIKRTIPIRFVQFFDDLDQILTDAQLQRGIDLANDTFRPAGLRFILWENLPYYSPEFAYPRDENKVLYMYEWPADVATSPLLKRLYYPDEAYCELGFERPPNNIETRYDAQMKAGTYCAPFGEILVYVNQGWSNGGQYPWYSRIIGMTRHHVPTFTFVHEIGHYLGLPHTFPGHQIYGLDYNFGRMIGAIVGKDLGTTVRRYYETTDRLLDPKTGDWADYSLFWDLVFAPSADGEHIFFHSRDAASAWEEVLQPIEQLRGGVLCRPEDPDCEESTSVTRLQMTVAAGCKGQERDFSDCDWPARNYYTGDSGVSALSRMGSTPETIQLNVMSYGYPWADGSNVGGGVVESVFLSQSQIEQIRRVLHHDVVTYDFDGMYGLRPTLGVCGRCHH